MSNDQCYFYSLRLYLVISSYFPTLTLAPLQPWKKSSWFVFAYDWVVEKWKINKFMVMHFLLRWFEWNTFAHTLETWEIHTPSYEVFYTWSICTLKDVERWEVECLDYWETLGTLYLLMSLSLALLMIYWRIFCLFHDF